MVVKSSFPTAPNGKKSVILQALPQVLAVCVKNVLLLGFGMTLGYPTILIPSLAANNDKYIKLESSDISWIGSINLICVPVGCFFSGAITQPVGRKRAMQFVNFPFVTAWLLFSFSSSLWQIFLAASLTGLTGGLLEAPVLTYVAEITQPHLRGILSSTSTMAVILGILVQFLLGTFYSWRTVALINCAVPLTSFILLFFVPETPHWLISKNRMLEARKSFAWLRGWTTLEEIETEFKELCQQLGKGKLVGIDNPAFEDNKTALPPKQNDSFLQKLSLDKLKIFTQKNFLWPYTLVSFSFFLGHFSGMTTLQTYAVQIFATLKTPINKYYATIILGAVELIGCIVCVVLVHYVGKRILNFVSLIGCSACFFIVATYSYCIDVKYLETMNTNSTSTIKNNPAEETSTYNWVPVTFLITSAFLSHIGIRILPWILTGEVYTNEARATASGLSGGLGYIFGFLSNKVFLSMISLLTLPGTFWLYSAIGLIGTIVLYFMLPETEGKSLFEITQHFSGKAKLNNKVYRKKKTEPHGDVNVGYINTEEKDKNFDVDVESKL